MIENRERREVPTLEVEKLHIEDFSKNEWIEMRDVSLIKQGDMLWENGDIVQIKDVEKSENRIEVWNKDKLLSELIYEHELAGVAKITQK